MSDYLGTTRLPGRKTNKFIRLVDKLNYWHLLLIGMSIYGAVVLITSGVCYLGAHCGHVLIDMTGGATPTFRDLVYFNFANILTLDHGPFSPIGAGKVITILEALVGVALLGVVISVVVVKLTNPSKNSIVFSKYGYYAIDTQSFFIIFVNTNRAPLVQAEMSLVIKTGFHWPIGSPIMAPYIGESAWTFFVGGPFPKSKIANLVLQGGDHDSIKFGISGSYGFANFASAMRYTFKDIIVVPSREPFEQDPIYDKPEYSSPEFVKAFHFKPEDSLNFYDYAKKLGAKEIISPNSSNERPDKWYIKMRKKFSKFVGRLLN